MENFDVKYTYHSTAIEGNTLTLHETSLVLDGISVGDKNIKEIFEVVNHSKAFDYIFKIKSKSERIIDVEDISKIHSIILDNINEYNRGVYRRVNVGISGTNIIFPYPNELPLLMYKFNEWLVREQEIGIIHPVKLAAQAHLRFVNIHPFVDGNGRTARLLMNMILLKNSYPPLIIEVDEKNKYIKAIQDSQDNDNDTFDKFIYDKMMESLDNIKKDFGFADI
jgi:Fic family protein